MARVAEMLGTPFMPWQRLVADVAGEVLPSGLPAYRKVVLTVPRQSGKTTELLGQAVHRALGYGRRQRIIYTAQTRQAARRKWEEEHVGALEASPFRPFFRTRLANGSEAIIWRNGSLHGIEASKSSSGHGETVDLPMIDEAFAQVDDRLEGAFMPAMVTRADAQLWVVSTAGDETSTYLRNLVDVGRESAGQRVTSGIAYFEWSCPDDLDFFDPVNWPVFMPALGHTVTPEVIAADVATMDPDVALRAYGNRWVRRGQVDALPGWDDCIVASSQIVGPLVLAVDASPDLMAASIAAVGRNQDGRWHVEVIEHRAGTGWVAARLAELERSWHPTAMVMPQSGPITALAPKFEQADLDVAELGTQEQARGAQDLAQLVRGEGDGIVHLGQAVVGAAVDGAVRRSWGDGGWLWSRKHSSVDISPLVAITAALRSSVLAETADIDMGGQVY